MNGTSFSASNIKSAVKNAVISKLYLAFTICTTVFTSLQITRFIISMIEAGKTGVYSDSVGNVNVILSIIGTIGLWVLRNGYENNDSSTAVSGIKMSKCFIALEVITNVIGYIISVLVLLSGLVFLAFNSISINEIIEEIEEALFEIGDPSLIEGFYEILDVLPSFSIIGAMLIIAGLVILAIVILCSIHRHKLSKAVNSIKNLEFGKANAFKIPKFAYGFGYVIGVAIFVSAFSVSVPYFKGALSIISYVLGILSTASGGVAVFVFSLWLSSVNKKVDELSYDFPQPIAQVDEVNSFFTFNDVKADEEISNNSDEGQNVDNGTAQSFCGECGAKIEENSNFCSNCGKKLI